MSTYQPYLIADFAAGLELGREPWLLPRDAFAVMEDAFIHRGVLQKRKGYTAFFSTGEDLAVTGIFHLVDAQGARIQLVADQYYLYESSGGGLVRVSHAARGSSPVWTGGAKDFIHWANWGGTVYMTNNKAVSGESTAGDGTGADGIQSYNGSAFQALRPDLTGAGCYVDRCAFLMVHKERLLLFSTQEDGAPHFQRVRWCKPGNPQDWTNDGFVDAPTSQALCGVAYLRDDIVAWFENSVWLLRYTADSSLPFRWEKLSTADGCGAPFSAAGFMDQGLSLGRGGLTLTDGMGVARVDEKIPDLALGFDQENMSACFGMVLEDQEQYWLLHPRAGSQVSDRVLVLNYGNWSWSLFNLDFNCLGFHTLDENVIWLDSPANPVRDMSGQAWQSCADPWVFNAAQAGYPAILAGDRSGGVFRVNNTGGDGGSEAIGFQVVSGRWNPFREMGLKARLGYVDFLVETQPAAEVAVDFYRDMENTAYQARTLSFDHPGEKAWVRIYAGAVGAFHRIRLHHAAAGQNVRIHAIMPWFKPAGRLS